VGSADEEEEPPLLLRRQEHSPSKKSDNSCSPRKVAEIMMMRKDRKIPSSVLKPHAGEVCVISFHHPFHLGETRVHFPYPQYCF